jgi:hypothetical protein
MERILFLPVYPEIPDADRTRLAEQIMGDAQSDVAPDRAYS